MYSRRLIFTFAAMAILVIKSGVGLLHAQTVAVQSGDKNLLEEKPFKDEKSGIQMNLPKGWVLKKNIEDTGYEAPAKDQGKDGRLAPNVVLSCSSAPGVKASDIDAVIKAKKAQYAVKFSGYREETSTDAKPDAIAQGFGRIDCSFMVGGKLRARESQVWIIVRDKVYIVTFASLDETYSANEKCFDAMIRSIVVP